MEDKQNLTEQQKILLSKLETLRTEMHRSVDARVDRSIQHILTSSVLEESPTLPLHTDPSVFKGKKPEAVLFPNGQSVRTPTWKAAVLAIRVKQRGCEGAGQARDRQTEGDWDQAWREDAGMIVEREQNSQPDALIFDILDKNEDIGSERNCFLRKRLGMTAMWCFCRKVLPLKMSSSDVE